MIPDDILTAAQSACAYLRTLPHDTPGLVPALDALNLAVTLETVRRAPADLRRSGRDVRGRAGAGSNPRRAFEGPRTAAVRREK